MILKSMSRKSASFGQLYNYMSRCDEVSERIYWNLPPLHDRASVVNAFRTNARLLPKRKNGNILLHEIVSFKRDTRMSLDTQKRVLRETCLEYLQKRALKQLCYGALHIEEGHLHYHLMLSVNALNSSKRVRLSKCSFKQIGHELERFVEARMCVKEREERSR